MLQKHHPAFPRLPVGSLTGGSDADFRGEPSGGCRLGAILCFANARWQNVHQASVLMKKKSFSCEVLFVLITGMLLNNAKKILAQLFSPTTHSLANQVFPSTGVLYQWNHHWSLQWGDKMPSRDFQCAFYFGCAYILSYPRRFFLPLYTKSFNVHFEVKEEMNFHNLCHFWSPLKNVTLHGKARRNWDKQASVHFSHSLRKHLYPSMQC